MAAADGEAVLGSSSPTSSPGTRLNRLSRAFGRRLSVLEDDLEAALGHDEASLHRSRVASRRLREILPLLASTESRPDARRVRKARRLIRGLTVALGGVRELDVGLAIVDEFERQLPEFADATSAVRETIERERLERREEMASDAAHLDAPRLLARLGRLRTVAADAAVTAGVRGALAARLESRSVRLMSEIEATGAIYAFDRLHRVRISAKKLRYGLELAHEVAGIGTTRLVTRVKGLQDLLGRLHDLEVVAGYVRVISSGPRRPASRHASRLLDAIESETRLLHAQYLARAAADHDLAQSIAASVVPRLLAHRYPRRHGRKEDRS